MKEIPRLPSRPGGRLLRAMPARPATSAPRPGRAPFWPDAATEILLALMILFSPWAFGTTQSWSIACMNAGGYLLGGLWLTKVFLRRRQASPAPCGFTWEKTLLALNAAVLGYILVAALNAEFIYLPAEWRQEPRAHLKWLPHSLDRDASWGVFWNWLALSGAFWAAHDWLTGERTAEGHVRGRRLRRMIFLLAANAALVALEGVIQRYSGTAKLLCFMPTRDNPTAAAQFGPYAYRANAAQFFNLVWPAALAVWWQLHTRARRATQAHHWLLPCVMLLMIGSLVSLSRGGAAVTLLQLLACAALLLVSGEFPRRARLGLALGLAATVGAAAFFGWEQLASRLETKDPLGGRGETYALAARMADDYPWFGTGPGTFGSVFQFYRPTPADYWPGQLHNDWLEYRITFGRLGGALLLAAFLTLLARAFRPGGQRVPWTFAAFLWTALAGCLLHARFDFPLQIYSIQFVFVLLCAALFSLAMHGRKNAG
jgi:O-antigen ligase